MKDIELRTVDNRVFLIGLDELYRQAIKQHEREELLKCAEQIASDLSLAPANVPVEGYYTEDESLTRYFLLVRALQNQSEERAAEISDPGAYNRLRQVTESPIYGVPSNNGQLLGGSRDALFYALEHAWPDWSVPTLTTLAYESASKSDRFYLVDLAALARDAVVLAGLRESVVLYSDLCFGTAAPPRPKYEWKVDREIKNRAGLFVKEFNRLFGEKLPRPCKANAAKYWEASDIYSLTGRCVRIGVDDSELPVRHYHWAIDRNEFGQMEVKDFWDSELWTTQRYRDSRGYQSFMDVVRQLDS